MWKPWPGPGRAGTSRARQPARRGPRRAACRGTWGCERGPRELPGRPGCGSPGRDLVGLGLRVHGNQLGEGPGVQLAVELGAASVDHVNYLAGPDVEALAGTWSGWDFACTATSSARAPACSLPWNLGLRAWTT